MAESTLSIATSELQAQVGAFLGYGRGATYGDPAWTNGQQNNITDCVKSGLKRVYFPEPLQGEVSSYAWSWIKPVYTTVLIPNQSTLPLPDDFGGFEGQTTLIGTQGNIWWPISLYNEGQLREQYALTPARSGRPLMMALQPIRGTTQLAGTRWQLYVFPLPDLAYQIQFQYYVLPDALSGNFPYALGGAAMAETYTEACLAVAESRLDDETGEHEAKFMKRLAAAINQDRLSKPQLLGYNRDMSDLRYGTGRPFPYQHYQDQITVNGVFYPGT